MKRLIAVLSIICFVLAGCAAPDPNEGGAASPSEVVVGEKNTVTQKVSGGQPAPVDENFYVGQNGFAVKLLQHSAETKQGENLLVSPLSVTAALAMTANGAVGETAEEMLAVLGGYSMEELNTYVAHYLQNLPFEKNAVLHLANSVWYRNTERLTVEQDFIQSNNDYYGAEIYKAPFDDTTVKEINDWVDRNTDGMIRELLDKIDENVVMYLINALAFDGKWETVYQSHQVYNGKFIAYGGKEQTAEMMVSDENYYLQDGQATGFLKNYDGGNYRFGALLPNEGVDIYDYVAGLTAEGFSDTLQAAERTAVEVQLPKFSYEYETDLKEVLAAMGMPSAFDSGRADFSGMATSAAGNIYINRVLHKTFIEVTENGTRAGAVTAVEAVDESAPMYEKEVLLNRPFVYFIIDAENNLPVFMGIVTSI